MVVARCTRLTGATWRGVSAAIWLLAASVPAAAEGPAEPENSWWAGDLSLTTGLDFSHGSYDDPIDTDLFYAPVTASYLFDRVPWWPERWDQLEFSLTVPYLYIDGPGNFFIDTRGLERLERTREGGLGDLFLRGSYVLYPRAPSWLPVTELGVAWKIPTGDADRGLGTGEHDVYVELDVSKNFGRVTPFATLGYRFIGDPGGGQLEDAWFSSLGIAASLAPRLQAGVYWTWLEASSPLRHDGHEILAYVALRLSDGLSISPYVLAGLGGHAPDWESA